MYMFIILSDFCKLSFHNLHWNCLKQIGNVLCPSLSSILDETKIKVKLKCHKNVAWKRKVECEMKCGCQLESVKGWMIEERNI